MIGFLSEHTAEFVLVPRLRSILVARFGVVTPVYFWKTREGNSLSNIIHKSEFVRVLALFPRRPKLTSPTEETIWGKINQKLLKYARASFSVGIPAIAGLPLAHSLPELWENPKPIWISLAHESPEDIFFEVETISRKIVSMHPEGQKLNIMAEKNIPFLVEENANRMAWPEAIAAIDMLRKELSRNNFYRSFLFFLGGYKPVYFFIFSSL